MIAKGLLSTQHPVLVHLIPIRRCNLSCAYCNEYDDFSKPVPTEVMIGRVDRLASLGTTIITLSGGEPLLHPELEEIIRRIRSHGILAGMITNGYLLTPQRIDWLNRAGLDHLQISIDNVKPDDVSKKSLKVLDRKLEMLAEHAIFHVNINSVIGSAVRNPEDALAVARRALELGFTSTVGILHDHTGQLQPLSERQQEIYSEIMQMGKRSYSRFNRFQQNISHGLPNELALPRRQPLPLRLRGRPGALLLAAARLSGHPAREIFPRHPRARVPHAEVLRAALHGLLRPAGRHARQLARPANPPGVCSPSNRSSRFPVL